MNSNLSDLEKIEESLFANFIHKKLHHGLLICGNKGIGKVNLALRIAKRIILDSSQDVDADLRKISLGLHPNLLLIKKEDKKRNISVESIRKINDFLKLTSALSKHRVIVIDATDDLNKNSSNAILKILEEPPTNVFLFLIYHNQTCLLRTIKSRCNIINIPNPNYELFKKAIINKAPEIEEIEIEILCQMSENSIATALMLHESQAIDLYIKLNQVIIAKNNNKIIFDLAKEIVDLEIFEIFEILIIFYLNRLVKNFSKITNSSELILEEEINSTKLICNKKNNLETLILMVDKIKIIFLTTKDLNLDKKQSIINIFHIFL